MQELKADIKRLEEFIEESQAAMYKAGKVLESIKEQLSTTISLTNIPRLKRYYKISHEGIIKAGGFKELEEKLSKNCKLYINSIDLPWNKELIINGVFKNHEEQYITNLGFIEITGREVREKLQVEEFKKEKGK